MLTFTREMTLKQYKTKKEIEGQNVKGKLHSALQEHTRVLKKNKLLISKILCILKNVFIF